jgi:hypothetical protein
VNTIILVVYLDQARFEVGAHLGEHPYAVPHADTWSTKSTVSAASVVFE